MRTPFKDKQQGTSMIELMIAAALLAVIGTLATSFFKRLNASDTEARARAGAISEMTLFLSTIERDFKLRPVPGPTDPKTPAVCSGSTSCSNFSINRMVRYNASAGALAGKDTIMKVDFSTTCVAAPAHMQPKFKNELSMQKNKASAAYTDGAATKSNALNGKCFRTANCGDGQYPQLQIKLNPTGPVSIPSYPRMTVATKVAKFPDLSTTNGVATGVIGAVLCGESAGSSYSDRLILETAYVNSEGLVRIEKKEVSIPRSNVANIQMLPSGDPLAPSIP